MTSTTSARLGVVREKYATYTSFGASLALSLGPTAWDWANGDLAGNAALYRSMRALSLIGVGVGTDLALKSMAQGALRGTLRGNVIVGTAVMITEVTWLLYEHGWQRAFYQLEFYEQVVGGASGLALGIGVGAYAAVLTSEFGPWVAGPVGFVAGTAAGTAGYLGGRSALRMILAIGWPELLQQQERVQFEQTREAIDMAIHRAQVLSAK